MKISLKNRTILKEKIEAKEIRKIVKALLENENRRLGEIEIVLLDDAEILKINKIFLKHDYFTDVISFGYNKKRKISGDIFISVESVKKNAVKFRQKFTNEFIRVIIHGTLHLVGYNDNSVDERKRMKKKENLYLKMAEKLVND